MDEVGSSAGYGDDSADVEFLSDLESPDVLQRQQIADATCRIISRGGLEDATFRRIAAELGATTGLISHYFASKADLLAYTINYAQERLAGQGLHTTWSTKDELFDDLCRAVNASDEDTAVFWRVWITFLGVALSDNDVRAEYLEWDGHTRREMLGMVRSELGEGAADDQVELVTDALNALATGVGILAILDPEHLDSERVRRILEHSFEGFIAAARDTTATKPTKGKSASRRAKK